MGILANESLTKVLWNEYVILEVSRCIVGTQKISD